jgi:hypothetical protein
MRLVAAAETGRPPAEAGGHVPWKERVQRTKGRSPQHAVGGIVGSQSGGLRSEDFRSLDRERITRPF